jgi:ribosomal-protein-serine acetyltransferase
LLREAEADMRHTEQSRQPPTRWHHLPMTLLPRWLTLESLRLRCWSPQDAFGMLIAIEESLPELEQWMPWAQQAPTAPDLHRILSQGEADFSADIGWDYTILDAHSDDVLGAIGLHRTEDPEKFEVGYWVRTSRVRQGVATTAVDAVIRAASTHLETARQVMVRMDQANLASASVARKLGFTLEGEEDREINAKSHTGRGYVWILKLAVDPPT